jgi:protocatechuate 3,4-dioxygenase beta subunit
MEIAMRRVGITLLLVTLHLSLSAWAQVGVFTWHYDNVRTGLNSEELVLSPANVNSQHFGKLFSFPLDGLVVGQALYVPALNVQGDIHNVVFVTTMHDSVYAFDADNPNVGVLWHTSLLNFAPAGSTVVDPATKGCAANIGWTEVGVISTPVIDPATNTIYLVSESQQGSQYSHFLSALDITTGLQRPGWPVKIAATYSFGGSTDVFNDRYQINRPGLLLANNHIYIAFGGPHCNTKDQGWLMSYNATTGAQEGVFETEPGKYWASIWQQGAALPIDADGYIYAETGEGPFIPGSHFGTSVLKFKQIGTTLALVDWFTPYNEQFLFSQDLDLNNAPLLLPDQPPPYPHELIAVGKQGTIYVLDRDNLGQNCSACVVTDTQILQELPSVVLFESGTPIEWNGRIYFTGHNALQVFTLSNGTVLTPPAQVTLAGGGHPVLTSNGAANGILWTMGSRALQAVDATTLKVLYTTNQAPNGRDILPTLAHFANEIVADGKVFIGAQNALLVYGLLPALSPEAGNNQTAQVGTPVSLTVKAADPYSGAPFPGITVAFSDAGKGGSFSNTSAVTDINGNVFTTYTLPTKAGTYTLTAVASGYASASFTETATTSAAVQLVIHSGNGQSTPVLTTFPKPLSAAVVDQYMNGIPGVVVTFNDNGAGGSFSANPVTSNLQGYATVSYTASTKAQFMKITAIAGVLPALTFGEKVTPGPASTVSIISGNNQTAAPSTKLAKSLVVRVADQYGNAIRGAVVQFSDNGAGGTFSATSVTTTSTGQAAVSYTTPSTSGTITIFASVSGVATPASFTVHVL